MIGRSPISDFRSLSLMIDLLNLTKEKLRELLASWGEPRIAPRRSSTGCTGSS